MRRLYSQIKGKVGNVFQSLPLNHYGEHIECIRHVQICNDFLKLVKGKMINTVNIACAKSDGGKS